MNENELSPTKYLGGKWQKKFEKSVKNVLLTFEA